jgi:hypothetical protein
MSGLAAQIAITALVVAVSASAAIADEDDDYERWFGFSEQVPSVS